MELSLFPALALGLVVILGFSSALHQNAIRPLPMLFLNFCLCLLLYRKFLGYPPDLWLCLSETDAWLLHTEDTPRGVLVGLSPDWMKLLATHHTTASKTEPDENKFLFSLLKEAGVQTWGECAERWKQLSSRDLRSMSYYWGIPPSTS